MDQSAQLSTYLSELVAETYDDRELAHVARFVALMALRRRMTPSLSLWPDILKILYTDHMQDLRGMDFKGMEKVFFFPAGKKTTGASIHTPV